MKKTNKLNLNLNTERLRNLTDSETKQAAGGWTGLYCSIRCSVSCEMCTYHCPLTDTCNC